MRIISGKRRGTHLDCPDGGEIRPTADRVREGLFNILSGTKYGDALSSPVIADVFAGVGSLGLECWSRGAAHIIFIENKPIALKTLTQNIKKLGCGDAAVIINRDAASPLAWPAAPAGLVFLDPPWIRDDQDDDLAQMALNNLIALGAIADGAIISIEHDHRRSAVIPDKVERLDVRKWGKTGVTLARFET